MWPFKSETPTNEASRRWGLSIDDLLLLRRSHGLTSKQASFLATRAAPQLVKDIRKPPKYVSDMEGGKPIRKEWSTEKAISEGYKSSSWVYACVSKRVESVSSVPFIVQVWQDDQWVIVDDHPLVRMIEKPNPSQNWQDVIETTVAHLDLGGNAIQKFSISSDKSLIKLYPLQPDEFTPVRSNKPGILIEYYERKLPGSSKPTRYEVPEILHFKYVDPAQPYWGISPLMAGSRVVDMDIASLDWNINSIENLAVPSGLVKVPDIDEEDLPVIRNYMKNEFVQGRGIGVLGTDAEFMRFGNTPVDMDFTAGRAMNREEIAAIFGVPPPIIGILDRATYSNIETARLMYWQDTIIPLLNNIVALYNFSLVNRYFEDTRIWYDLSANPIMMLIRRQKIEDAAKLTTQGVPFNLAAEFVGLDIGEIEGGDVGYLPSNLLPSTSVIDARLSPVGVESVIEDDE